MVMATTPINESLNSKVDGEVSLSLQETSTDGSDWLQISFPKPLPSDGSFLVLITGSEEKHSVSANRNDDCTLSLQLPAHNKPETVTLKVCHVVSEQFSSEQPCLLYERDFVYTNSTYDVSQYQAELLMQSMVDAQAAKLLYSVLPPLVALSPEELQDFDHSLTEAVKRTKLPAGWGMTGVGGESQEQAKPQQLALDTPLHFSAKYKLTQLFSHLLTFPGVLQALSTPNEQGLLPSDLAKESGCEEIMYLIAEATGSPSNATEPLGPTQPPTPPTADCQPTREECMKEINEQRTHPVQSGLDALPKTTHFVHPSGASSIFSAHLDRPMGTTNPELLLKEWIQRRSWPKRHRCHSLNEVYIRKAGVQAGTAVQPDSTLLPQQIRQLGHGNRSWPSLNGSLPAEGQSSSFLSSFLHSSHGQTTDQEAAADLMADVYSLDVPAIRVQDHERDEGVHLKTGAATFPKTSSQESLGEGSMKEHRAAKRVASFDISKEDSDVHVEPFQIHFSSPLASKSAPDLSHIGEPDQADGDIRNSLGAGLEDVTDGLITEAKKQKTYSDVVVPEETSPLSLPSVPLVGSEDEELSTLETTGEKSPVSEGRFSPVMRREKQRYNRRGHQKSFSVSGANVFVEDEEDGVAQEKLEEEVSRSIVEPPVNTAEIERSRGSSLISSSSKQESSLSDGGEYDLEDERLLATGEAIKTRSEVSFHTDTEVFLGGRPMERQTSVSLSALNSHSEEGSRTVVESQSDVTSRHMPSQLSAVVITNIDEYCASGEDEDEGESSRSLSLLQTQQGAEEHSSSMSNSSVNSEAAAVIRELLHLSSGQTGSPSSADKRISVGSDVFAEDIALSDIELKVESLNSSLSIEGAFEEKLQVGNGSIPQHHLDETVGDHHDSSSTRRETPPAKPPMVISPLSSSQNLDDAAHSTISKLRFLTTGTSTPIFKEEAEPGGHWSDSSRALAHGASPEGASPEGSKTSPRLTRQTGSFNVRRTPANRVARSATTVSEGNNNHRKYRCDPALTVSEVSSLDFPMSTTGPISPRKSDVGPHPTSPLVTSPRSHTSMTPGYLEHSSPTSLLVYDKEGEEHRPESAEVVPVLRRDSALVTSSSPKERKSLSRSADNLLSSDLLKSEPENSRGDKPTEDSKKDDKDSSIKLLRFRQFEDEGMFLPEEAKGAAPATEEAKGHEKPTKKGLTRLLSRRDSKKDRRPERVPKKSDSTSSLDSVAQTGPEDSQHKYHVVKEKSAKSRPSAQEIEFIPPTGKSRASTLVGGSMNDLSLTGGSSPSSHHRRLNSKFDTVEEREESASPNRAVSPLSKVDTLSLGGDRSESSSLSVSFEEPPELVEESLAYLNQTMNRRIKKYSNKHERARQGTIFDWIRTEQHFYLSLILLKTVFRDRLRVQLNLSEEVLQQLFPFLDGLIEVSKSFSQKLLKRQKESQLEDISDILLERFSGHGGDEMLRVYSGFVCREPAALELYRDFERKRGKFMRVINVLYQNKHCERKKLPDFYLLMAQRVSKYVEMMKKLIKESEALKLPHVPRLRESSVALDKLVMSVDLAVKDYNNHKELEEIQNRLEVQIPKSLMKTWDRKGLKNLDLLAQNRKLLKRGEAIWQGHGKQLAVHIVLVTDILVMLTERDQKYNIAQLQDLKPPVVRLYGLHVRMNASVKSGVQLLLLEQGDHPEMFRLEFTSKKVAKEWEESLNVAAEFCKTNELKCEYFGAEPMHSGDEHLDEESDEEGEKDESIQVARSNSDSSPNSLRRAMVDNALEQANRLLASSTSIEETVFSSRNQTMMPSSGNKDATYSGIKPVRPVRSTTMHSQARPQSGIEGGADAAYKRKGNKKSIKDKCTYCEDAASEKQILLECISKLKESMEYLLEENQDKDRQISRYRAEVERLRAEQRVESRESSDGSGPVLQRSLGSRSSLKNRPLSLHSDLFENGAAPDFSHLSPSPKASSHRTGQRIKEVNAHWNLM